MFKKLVAIFLALGMLIVPIPIKVMAATETDGFLVPVAQKDTVPYGYTGIYTAEDFNNIRENLSGQYILMNDIDLSLFQSWNPIGENEKEELKDFSVITFKHKVGNKDIGTIGIIGPKRMDYSKVISVMKYISKKLNEDKQ